MPRKRPKSLDAPVVVSAKRLEAWAYLRCDEWKKKYRYTLINEFRSHITNAKNEIIVAFELQNRFRTEKSYHYQKALAELAITESNMDIMILNEIGIMGEKDWANCAAQIDEMRIALSRLLNSLNKGSSGSEPPIFGEAGESAGYKDV